MCVICACIYTPSICHVCDVCMHIHTLHLSCVCDVCLQHHNSSFQHILSDSTLPVMVRLDNDLGTAGVQAISACVRHMRHLHVLDLSRRLIHSTCPSLKMHYTSTYAVHDHFTVLLRREQHQRGRRGPSWRRAATNAAADRLVSKQFVRVAAASCRTQHNPSIAVNPLGDAGVEQLRAGLVVQRGLHRLDLERGQSSHVISAQHYLNSLPLIGHQLIECDGRV